MKSYRMFINGVEVKCFPKDTFWEMIYEGERMRITFPIIQKSKDGNIFVIERERKNVCVNKDFEIISDPYAHIELIGYGKLAKARKVDAIGILVRHQVAILEKKNGRYEEVSDFYVDIKLEKNNLAIARKGTFKYVILEKKNGRYEEVSGVYAGIELIGKKFAKAEMENGYEVILRRKDGIYRKVSTFCYNVELLKGGKYAISTKFIRGKKTDEKRKYILFYNGKEFEKIHGPYEQINVEADKKNIKLFAFNGDALDMFDVKNGKIIQTY